MSIPIKTKRSTTATNEPTGLVLGELAVNVADTPPTLFVGNGASALRVGPVIVQTGQPSAPKPGTLWVDNTTGVMQLWAVGQWIFVGGGTQVLDGVPPANPISGQGWYNSATGRSYVWYEDPDSSQWVETK